MLDGRARGTVAQALVDPCRVQREVLADTNVVDGNARVLTDEVLLAVGDVDVLVDRLEHASPGDRRLLLASSGERIAQVLRNVLERPHVEVGRRVLDRVLQVGGGVDRH